MSLIERQTGCPAAWLRVLALCCALTLLPWPGAPAPAAAQTESCGIRPGTPGGINDGLVRWLRADTGTVRIDGSPAGHNEDVPIWRDQLDRSNTITQFTPGRQPHRWSGSLNGKAVLWFGGSDWMQGQLDGLSGDQPYTIISVYVPWGHSNRALFGIGQDSAHRGITHQPLLPLPEGGRALSHIDRAMHTPVMRSGVRIETLRYTAAHSETNRFLYDRGHLVGSDTASLNLPANPPLVLGGRFGDDTPPAESLLDGDIAEFLVYNRALSEAERLRVDSALALTYGITLGTPDQPANYDASDGTRIWDGAHNATYQRGVGGIGRDDCAGFNQQRAQSSESGQELIIEAAEAFATDKSFLLWGHNGNGMARSTDVPQGFKQRLARVWRAQAQGSPVQVNISFDLNQFDAANIQDPAKFALLIGKAPDSFHNVSPQAQKPTLSGSQITFSDVMLKSGDYFTLAYPPRAPGGIDRALQLWLNNSNLMLNAHGLQAADKEAVSVWMDASGNNHHARQSVPISQPVFLRYGISMNKSILFGGNDFLENGTLPQNFDNHTLFVVASTADRARQAGYLSLNVPGNTDRPALMQLGDGTQAGVRPHSSTGGSGPAVPISAGALGLRAIRAAGQITVGSSTGSIASGAVDWAPSGEQPGYYIARYSGDDPPDALFNGLISEIILYSDTLTLDEQHKIETYLALKYGTPLMHGDTALNYINSRGTVVWDASANAGYNHDVNGFGTDYATGLNSNASPVWGSDDVLGMTARETTGKPDETVLLWGNDNGAIGPSRNVPAGFQQRLERVWKFQLTGQTSKLKPAVIIDLSTFGDANFSNRAGFALLISDGPDFSQVKRIVRNPFIIRSMVAFDNANLASGDYVTLAYPARPLATPVVHAPPARSIVATAQPQLSGSAPLSTTVEVQQGAATICQADTQPDGTWVCQPSQALSDGEQTLSVVAVNQWGRRSASVDHQLVVDTVAPERPVVRQPAPNSFIALRRPAFLGTGEPGATITMTLPLDAGSAHCAARVQPDGAWGCALDTELTEGAHTLVASQTDRAGHHSPSLSQAFTIDTTAPSAPVITAPAAGSLLSSAQPTVGGTAEPHASVTVQHAQGSYCAATAQPDGTWRCAPTTALADGEQALRAAAIDRAGNQSPAQITSFTIDTVAPERPTVSQPATNSIVETRRPAFLGTGEPGATITVTVALDGPSHCSTHVQPDGAWVCALGVDLTEGRHTLVVSQTDRAGHHSPPISRAFTVDTLAPRPPVITAPAAGSLLRTARPTISGTAEPNTSVAVQSDARIYCAAVVQPDGTWSCTPPAALAEGEHVVRAATIDQAGHQSPAKSRRFSIDTRAPAAPTVDKPAARTVRMRWPRFSGAAEPGVRVVVSSGATALCQTTADPAGRWGCQTGPLPNGVHALDIVAHDLAGNRSTPRAYRLTIAAPLAARRPPP